MNKSTALSHANTSSRKSKQVEPQPDLPIKPLMSSLQKHTRRVPQPSSPRVLTNGLPNQPQRHQKCQRASSFRPHPSSEEPSPNQPLLGTFPLVRRKAYSDRDCVASLYKKIYGSPLSEVFRNPQQQNNNNNHNNHKQSLQPPTTTKSSNNQFALNFDLSVECIRKQRQLKRLNDSSKNTIGTHKVPDFKALSELHSQQVPDFTKMFTSQLVRITPI